MASSLYCIESQYIHEIREEEKVCNLNKVRGEDLDIKQNKYVRQPKQCIFFNT